ncbi:hypothetical protein KPL78_09700 [Roseomonas sp. HJA6]|uniref:Uncharacterized protein n=1 Tax=Roseomonas alba TaxID=2846776 RepID=A0ABS7A9X9_9PROT|nr:hypothetical protein [Neoroseomonas alba]MBW6398120.1 hypothetical protein [Neoroseomonas alba]
MTVNDQVVAHADMPRNGPVELAGTAEGANVAALCTPQMVARATLRVTCLVMVANERAATLSLVAGTQPPG